MIRSIADLAVRSARVAGLVCGAALALPALAQPSVTFDGERYVQRMDNRRGAIPVVEYVRPNESLQTWTKLVAIRHFATQTDARAAASTLARVVREHNPNARADVIARNDGSEAIVDFITFAKGDDRLEFNVHRYRKVEGLPGLVGYQFAWRFRTSELRDATKTVSANRKRWIDEMTRADFGNPFAAKGAPR
jgi:hypothetical protein